MAAEAAAVKDEWFNQTLLAVNDSVMRLGVLEGEFHWHSHTGDDELFLVMEGRLLIDVEGHDSLDLGPGQAAVVPRGLRHRPRAPSRTVVLMVETSSIEPTGDG